MSFSNPLALGLLALVPLFIWLGYPRTPYRRRRGLLSLGLRLVLVLLFVLALAGLQMPRLADRLAVVFLVDVSDSMSPRIQAEAVDYVRTALAEMDADRDQAAVVLFGANAVVEQGLSSRLDLSQLTARPISLNTDLAEAVRLGLALFPPDAAKRLVVLSDGLETVGDAKSAARLAAATNVQIDYVAFPREVLAGEILVKEVILPPRLNEGEVFDLIVNVESESATNANLRVLAGGRVIYEQVVAVTAGENRFAVGPLTLPETGFVDFRVQIEPQTADAFAQNNELSAFTEVRGRPTVLLVTSDERETRYLAPAMQENGLVVETVAPNALPTGLASLSQYSAIVLANVSATDLSRERMELLQIYVRDLGGGLVAIGGPDSYGVGGYFQTPLEETLPLEMRIRDQQRVPTLTILFVIDRSGSMEAVSDPRGFTNLELAKEAIQRSLDFLQDYDRVGIISFDSTAYFLVDMQEVGDAVNRRALSDEIGALRPGGGTDIYGALQAANTILPAEPSALKHMILLTDGGADPTGTLELADQLYTQYGVTLSAVGVGVGYAPWLRDLTVAGRGNFHEVFDISTIPSIFAAETVIATRSYIMEETFFPTLTARSPIMEGIASLPDLQGYIATTEKDTATVILRGPEDDPLLASWQYGLGRAVAFTSDATARWGVNWVTWEDFARFWGQAVRWTITEGTDSNLEVRIEQRGEQAYLVVDARDDEGEFLNGLALNTAIITPALTSQTLNIPQVAPGRYEVAFTPESQGAYFLRVAGATPDGAQSAAQTGGWVLSYSAEYRLDEGNTRLLQDMAALTGGESLLGRPAAAFNHNLDRQRTPQSLWQTLLALAAFLWIGDIAVRRLVLNRSDWLALRAFLAQRLGIGRARARREATSGRLGGLMDAKRRTLEDLPPSKLDTEVPPASPTPFTSAPPAPMPKVSPPKAKPSPQKVEGTLAARLLEKRKGDK